MYKGLVWKLVLDSFECTTEQSIGTKKCQNWK